VPWEGPRDAPGQQDRRERPDGRVVPMTSAKPTLRQGDAPLAYPSAPARAAAARPGTERPGKRARVGGRSARCRGRLPAAKAASEGTPLRNVMRASRSGAPPASRPPEESARNRAQPRDRHREPGGPLRPLAAHLGRRRRGRTVAGWARRGGGRALVRRGWLGHDVSFHRWKRGRVRGYPPRARSGDRGGQTGQPDVS
jgi:hypothetical protein